MEERNIEVTIFKSENPNELSVYHAVSLEDEIRFYLNETQYVSATDKRDENISVELREVKETENKKFKRILLKKDYLEITLFCFGVATISLAIIAVAAILGAYFNSMFVYLIILNTLMFVSDIVRIVLLESRTTAPSLKSKHSAEHMMVNFLEKHKRLPKSIAETKTASRFCEGCGSRKLIKGTAEEFISKIVATILACTVSAVYRIFCSNVVIDGIILLVVYLGVIILFQFIFKKSDKMNHLLKPIRKTLTKLAQYANTTKKVKDDDIYLAYLAAREWIKIVYPEYYNKEQDVFIENI